MLNKCHAAKREAALDENDAGLAKREAVVAAIIETMKEWDASASEILEQIITMFTARVSLFDVTKSALADVEVP